MQVEISEKKLVGGLALLALGVFILLNAAIVTVPVRVSEKGLLVAIAACCLIVYGLNLLWHSRLKA